MEVSHFGFPFSLSPVPNPVKVDKSHFRECLLETLTEMFGQDCVNPLIRGDKMTMVVDDKTIYIDLTSLVQTYSRQSTGLILR